MKEIVFLKRYQEKWKELETLLASQGKKDPDKLSALYIQLTDDLSYARTYYPDSNTTRYLNTLSAQLHHEIYKNKKESSGRFITFWKYEVPLAIARNFGILQLSFVLFVISFAIGWLSASRDSKFTELILSPEYVEMTQQYIDEGRPMNVYGDSAEGGMFLYITLNNIYVSFLFFVLGITFGIGTIWRLISTGIMVGTFLQFFYAKNYLTDAMLAIWMHGTIEISICIIACAAGIVLGKSIIFTGTYTRLESIKRGATDGLKIVIGLVPCFIMAGFIESFLTRHYNYNVVLSASVIVLSLTFILSYFVVYPWYLSRKLKHEELTNTGEDANDGTQDIVIGSLFLLLGIIVTLGTFSAPMGGISVLFFGPVIYGIFRMVRGIRQNRKKKIYSRS